MGSTYYCDWNLNDSIRFEFNNTGYEDYQRYLSDQKLNHE